MAIELGDPDGMGYPLVRTAPTAQVPWVRSFAVPIDHARWLQPAARAKTGHGVLSV